ncbi:MAG: hypothetical protein FJ077_15675 [Cyanobacteria bacterium K_DeepCast_35m_m2_023]|nr:hypothetical protein [Cyanobacteria bacterium K_DeepCast_35m_m2_023]
MAAASKPFDNGTPQAVNDLLTGGCFEPSSSYIAGTVKQLLANDRGTKNFYGLVGADANGVLTFDQGSIKIVDGNIIFNTNANFTGGKVAFDYQIRMGNKGVLSAASVAFEAKQMVTFDQLSPGQSPIPNGYAGLNWSNQWAFQPTANYGGYSILSDGPGDNVAYNAFADPSSVSTANADFDFLTGVFSAAWNNDLNLQIKAFDDGVEVGSLLLVMDPVEVKVDFANMMAAGADSAVFTGRFNSIDSLAFVSSGGTNAGLPGGGSHFATDSWCIGFETVLV